MRDNMFNNHSGKRGSTKITLTFAELYEILVERVEYISLDSDPDAVVQNMCCEIEKKMGIYPNVEKLHG